MSEEERLTKRLRALLAEEHLRSLDVIEALREFHPEDLAELLPGFPDDDLSLLFSHLDTEAAAVVLEEIDPVSRRVILEKISHHQLAEIVDEMPPDEGADVLEDIAPAREAQVLEGVDVEQAAAIRSLREYDPESAGGIMTTEFVALAETDTADDAIRKVRQAAEDTEDIAALYVLDPAGALRGVVSIREVITARGDRPLAEFMERDVIYTTADTDQEEVAQRFDKYNLKMLPVVDDHLHLLGIVTVDDVIDVIHEEASEDFFRLAGMAADYGEGERIGTRVIKRLPFLLVTILGGVALIFILEAYRATMQTRLSLVFFMPFMNALGGNVGLQSSTLIVRGLALGEIRAQHILTLALKEFVVGALIALVCALVGGGLSRLVDGHPALGLVVGTSMFCGITFANCMGVVVPLVCARLRIDPALASGPFVTTLNDITTVIIYMTIATFMLQALATEG